MSREAHHANVGCADSARKLNYNGCAGGDVDSDFTSQLEKARNTTNLANLRAAKAAAVAKYLTDEYECSKNFNCNIATGNHFESGFN